MLKLVLLYGQGFLHNFIAIVMGGMAFGLDIAARMVWPRYKRWAEGHGKLRYGIEVAVIVLAALWASFAVWRQEYTNHLNDLKDLKEQVQQQTKRADDLSRQIYAPDGLMAQLQRRTVAPSALPSPGPAPPAPQASADDKPNITLEKYDLTTIFPDDGTHDKLVRLWLKNVSNYPAYAPVVTSDMKFIDPKADPKMDEELNRVIAATLKVKPITGTQVIPQQESYKPLFRVKLSDFDDVVAGKKWMYVYAVITFVNDTTPKGKAWMEEFVTRQISSPDVYEIVHHKTHLIDLKG